MNDLATPRSSARDISLGIPRLDEITNGGLPPGEVYVVNGQPGTGKTILALHFLAAGAAAGETVLCIALSQRTESLKQTAHSVGIDTRKIQFQELTSVKALQYVTERQTVFDTSELELEQTMSAFTQVIEDIQPNRVVFDSISYLRMLANDPLTYRRQLLTLRDFLMDRDITVLLTDTQELAPGENELVAMAHGVITLSQELTVHGFEHRYLRIHKIRSKAYQAGKQSMTISDQGMQVYPQLTQPKVSKQEAPTLVKSGVEALDNMIGGGLLTGTSCLLVGPSGTGKTSTTTLFAENFARQQGGKVSFFLFDELYRTFALRSAGLGIEIEHWLDQDQMQFHELGLGDLTVGYFSDMVRRSVSDWGAQMVVIDTLTGYLSSMPSEKDLIAQMHELLLFLNSQNVLSFLIVAQHGILGSDLTVPVDVSYLADLVLMLRHFESQGTLKQAISVYKKRYGTHENRIRELQISSKGICLGEPLDQFRGILSGTPDYVGDLDHLLNNHDNQ